MTKRKAALVWAGVEGGAVVGAACTQLADQTARDADLGERGLEELAAVYGISHGTGLRALEPRCDALIAKKFRVHHHVLAMMQSAALDLASRG